MSTKSHIEKIQLEIEAIEVFRGTFLDVQNIYYGQLTNETITHLTSMHVNKSHVEDIRLS